MSGFYIGVDGKARKVKGGYIGIDGKARKIKKGYIGDASGVARLCWSDVDPVFANNTWEEIAVACQNGNVPTSWAVGDQKTMTIDGVEYAIDIIGKNHDEYSDGSGLAPLTFQLHEVIEPAYKMNATAINSTGWESSAMRKTHLPELLSKMPPEVQAAIREVNKLTSKGNKSSTIAQTADKLFLLSEVEVTGSPLHAFAGEGGQYSYYSRGNDKAKRLIEERGGSTVSWWLRSPSRIDGGAFCAVIQDGSVSKYNASYITVYPAPAFCF